MTNSGDAAFARPYTEYGSSQEGLTKREYFAALVLQGLIANEGAAGVSSSADMEKDCKRSVAYADFLVNALNEKQ